MSFRVAGIVSAAAITTGYTFMQKKGERGQRAFCAGNADNSAFVFIKPHANTPQAQAYVKEGAKAKQAGKLVKLGGGFYCGLIDTIPGKSPIYVFNGFFMSMRSKFVTPGTS